MHKSWTEDRVRSLIRTGETAYVDFKQAWYDLSKGTDTAEMAKDMMAMANTATPEQPGVLLIGVTNDGKVCGVGDAPTQESINQILAGYISPPPTSSMMRVTVSGAPVDVIEIPFSPYRPHYGNRDTPAFKRDMALVRRGATTAMLSIAEIAAMIRQADYKLSDEPLEFGFLDAMNWSSGVLTARLVNVTQSPVGDIRLMLELTPRRMVIRRRTLLVGATLAPGESREIQLEIVSLLATAITEKGSADSEAFDPARFLHHRWCDVTLYLCYRDQAGYLQTRQQVMHLAD